MSYRYVCRERSDRMHAPHGGRLRRATCSCEAQEAARAQTALGFVGQPTPEHARPARPVHSGHQAKLHACRHTARAGRGLRRISRQHHRSQGHTRKAGRPGQCSNVVNTGRALLQARGVGSRRGLQAVPAAGHAYAPVTRTKAGADHLLLVGPPSLQARARQHGAMLGGLRETCVHCSSPRSGALCGGIGRRAPDCRRRMLAWQSRSRCPAPCPAGRRP